MMPLEYILVVMTNSYHSKTKQNTSTVFWKGSLYTGFTVMVKIDSRDSISEIYLVRIEVNTV